MSGRARLSAAVGGPAGPVGVLAEHLGELLRRRELIRFLAISRQRGAYFRTVLGGAWFLLDPLAHIAVYFLLLVVVLGAGPRYGVHPLVFLTVGIGHYFAVQKAVARAGGSITSRRAILLQVNIEPLVFVAVAFRQVLREVIIFVGLTGVLWLALDPHISWRLLAYPVALLGLVVFAWGATLAVATLAVFIRDVQNMTAIILRLGRYLSPVLFPLGFVPAPWDIVVMLNPLAGYFGLLHWSLFGMPAPPLWVIAYALLATLALVVAAHLGYQRVRGRITKVV